MLAFWEDYSRVVVFIPKKVLKSPEIPLKNWKTTKKKSVLTCFDPHGDGSYLTPRDTIYIATAEGPRSRPSSSSKPPSWPCSWGSLWTTNQSARLSPIGQALLRTSHSPEIEIQMAQTTKTPKTVSLSCLPAREKITDLSPSDLSPICPSKSSTSLLIWFHLSTASWKFCLQRSFDFHCNTQGEHVFTKDARRITDDNTCQKL